MPTIPALPPETSATEATFLCNGGSVTNAAALNVALPAVVGKTNWLTGFDVTGAGATAASVINVTIVGTTGATLNYGMSVPAGANLDINTSRLIVRYPPPGIPANASNQAITLTIPAFGSGNTITAGTIYGFVQ